MNKDERVLASSESSGKPSVSLSLSLSLPFAWWTGHALESIALVGREEDRNGGRGSSVAALGGDGTSDDVESTRGTTGSKRMTGRRERVLFCCGCKGQLRRRDERVWEERQEKRGEPTPDRSSRSEREIAMGPSGWGQGSESLVGPCSKTFPVRPRGYPFRASWRVPLIARRPISPFSRGNGGGDGHHWSGGSCRPLARNGTARDGQAQSGQSQATLGAVPIAGARSAQRPRPASDVSC